MAHMAGHFFAFKNLLRVHRAYRARASVAAAAMGFAPTFKVMALNRTRKPLAFSCARYVYYIADFKNVGLDIFADLDVFL